MAPLVVGALLMLIETLWGAIAVLPLDWHRLPDIVVGISFVVGLLSYLLDALSKKRIIIFLPALFLFRWLALSVATTHPSLLAPLQVNVLLIPASMLLQWSKRRRPARAAV